MSSKGDQRYWASKTSPKQAAQKRASKEASATCKRLRHQIHRLIDPIWKGGLMERATIYKRLGQATGDPNFHNRTLFNEEVGIKALNEATKIYTEAITRNIGGTNKRRGKRR